MKYHFDDAANVVRNLAQQRMSYECGVFVCVYCERYPRDESMQSIDELQLSDMRSVIRSIIGEYDLLSQCRRGAP